MRVSYPTLLTLLIPLGLWLNSCWELHFEWAINEQYAYALFVPFLALYLFYLRTLDRPAPLPSQIDIPVLPFVLGSVIITYLTAITFPANVDWRALHWLQGLTAATISYLFLYKMGGRRWTLHFGFIIAFLLVIIPWPRFAEKFLIENLMAFVATATVDILNLCGVFADQHGNVIIISKGALNVAEACSGVRSFQSTLMGGLFLGELFRLGLRARTFLIVLSCLLAFIFNVVRSLVLAYLADLHGTDLVSTWHDPAGYFIFAASFSCLFILAFLFRRTNCKPYLKPAPYSLPQWALPTRQAIIITAFIACALPCSYLWYDFEATTHTYQPDWKLDFSSIPGAQSKPLKQAIQSILFTDDGQQVSWEDLEGRYWQVYDMQWYSPEAGQIAGLHSPGQCLPSAGWSNVSKAPPITWEKEGVTLVIDVFTFKNKLQTIYVFDCQWDPSGYPYGQTGGLRSYQDRLYDILHGNRKANKKTIEWVGEGFDSMEDATKAFLTNLALCFVLNPLQPTLEHNLK